MKDANNCCCFFNANTYSYTPEFAHVLPQKVTFKFLPRVRAIYLRRRECFFWFLLCQLSEPGQRATGYNIICPEARTGPLLEPGAGSARASGPRRGDVEVGSSGFCPISVAVSLADGAQPGHGKEGSRALGGSILRISVDVCVSRGAGLCPSPRGR